MRPSMDALSEIEIWPNPWILEVVSSKRLPTMSVFEGGLNGAFPPFTFTLPPLLSAARRRRPETTAPTICAA